jgi:hypothetical protein
LYSPKTLTSNEKTIFLQVSSQKHKMKEGFQKIAMHWVITGHADVTKLSEGVVEFCRGMEIYEVEKYDKNGANVIKGIFRTFTSPEMTFSQSQLYSLVGLFRCTNEGLR